MSRVDRGQPAGDLQVSAAGAGSGARISAGRSGLYILVCGKTATCTACEEIVRSPAFGTGVLALLASLALLAGLVLLAVELITQGVGRSSSWTSVLGTSVAIAGALVTVMTWWLRQRAAARRPVRSEQVTQAAQELQAAVREQWRKEAEARSLGDPDPMPVRWRLSDPAVMDHDDHIALVPLRFTGRSDQILAFTDQFRKLRRRRLVIVGGPGTGKTTLAVQLVLQLLADWQPGEPVPVLLSLASWDPHTRPRLQDWLATQLNQIYPDLRAFGINTAQRLAEQGWLLPVLDGLDEIPAERRGEVIEALNASLHPDTGLIMTSRTTEYTETVRARDVLTAAAVIEPEPLTAREAAKYLKDRLPRQPDESWQAVLTAFWDGTAGALAEVVASPLGLWLLGTVYIDGHRDPRPLINPGRYRDAATIQHHLLNELIPAVVHSRSPLPSGKDSLRPQHHHNPDQAQRWLTALAIELRNAQTRDWRWWQLPRHTFTTPGLVFVLVVGLVGVLVVGLASVLIIALVGRLGGLASGLVVGLSALFGLVSELAAVYSDVPAHTDLQIRGRIKALGSKLTSGLLAGLAGGLAFGLASGLVGGLASGLVGGLAFGLVFGVMVGLISFAASPSIARRASSPEESLRGDRRLSLFNTGMFVLVFVLFGLFGLLGLFELVPGLMGGLVGGLLVGLVGGPVMPRTCWPAFVVTSLWLTVLRRMPFGLMKFLDEAYRLGLLRVVGPVYQFRHATLQDHLAPLVEARLTTTANS